MPQTYTYPNAPKAPAEGDRYLNKWGAWTIFQNGDWQLDDTPQPLDGDAPIGNQATPWRTPVGPPEPFHRPVMYIPGQTVPGVERGWQRKENARRGLAQSSVDMTPPQDVGPPAPPPAPREPSALQQTLLTAGRVIPAQLGAIGGGVLGTAVMGPGGGTALGAGLGAAALTALGETVMEGAEKALGYRSDINPYQVAGQAAAAGAMAPIGVGRLAGIPGAKGALLRTGTGQLQGGALAGLSGAGTAWAEAEHEGRPFTAGEAWEAGRAAVPYGLAVGSAVPMVQGAKTGQQALIRRMQQGALKKSIPNATGYALDPRVENIYDLLPDDVPIGRLIARTGTIGDEAVGGRVPQVDTQIPVSKGQLELAKQAFPQLAKEPWWDLPTNPRAAAAQAATAGRPPVPPATPNLPAEFAPVEPVPPPATPPPFGIPGSPRGGPSAGFLQPEIAGAIAGAAVGGPLGAMVAPEEHSLSGGVGGAIFGAFGGAIGMGRLTNLKPATKTVALHTAITVDPALGPAYQAFGSTGQYKTGPTRSTIGATLRTLPRQVQEATRELFDPHPELSRDLTRYQQARIQMANYASRLGEVPHVTAQKINKVFFKPATTLDDTDFETVARLLHARQQIGSYEVQESRNLAIRAKNEAIANGLEPGTPQPEAPILMEGHLNPQEAYASYNAMLRKMTELMTPEANTVIERVDTHLRGMGEQLLAEGRLSQQSFDRRWADGRPGMGYWPAFVLSADDKLGQFYSGAAHPSRAKAWGTLKRHGGHTSETVTNPYEVLYRYTAAWDMDRATEDLITQLAHDYDPRTIDPNIKATYGPMTDEASRPIPGTQTIVKENIPEGYEVLAWPPSWAKSTEDVPTGIVTPAKSSLFVLPVPIIRTLKRNQARVINPALGAIERTGQRWTSAARGWILNPIAVGVNFDLNNLAGDSIKLVETTPIRDWGKLPRQAQEAIIGQILDGSPGFDPELSAKVQSVLPYIGLGSASAEFAETQYRNPQLMDVALSPTVVSADGRLINPLGRSIERSINMAWGDASRTVTLLRRYRESGPRLIKAIQQLDAGYPPEYAGYIANHTLVNYSSLSPFEQRALRGLMFPFYTWMARTLQQATPGLNRDAMTGSKWIGAAQSMGVQARALGVHSLMMLWNEGMFPQIEHELPAWQHELPHVILPVGMKDNEDTLELGVFTFTNTQALTQQGMTEPKTQGAIARWLSEMTQATQDPDHANLYVLGAPGPLHVAGTLLGLNGLQQNAFDYLIGYEQAKSKLSPSHIGEEAWRGWASILNPIVTVPTTLLTGYDIRSGRSGIGDSLPITLSGRQGKAWTPDSPNVADQLDQPMEAAGNPFAAGTKYGQRAQAAIASIPPISTWNRSMRQGDTVSEDWLNYSWNAIFGSLVRKVDQESNYMTSLMSDYVEVLKEASEARTTEQRQAAYASGITTFLTMARRKGDKIVGEEPSEFPGKDFFAGPEGPDLALAWYNGAKLMRGKQADYGKKLAAHLENIAAAQVEMNPSQAKQWQQTRRLMVFGQASLDLDEEARFMARRANQSRLTSMGLWQKLDEALSGTSPESPMVIPRERTRDLNQWLQDNPPVTTAPTTR